MQHNLNPAHQDIAEKTYALARAYIQCGLLAEAKEVHANALWHERQSKRTMVGSDGRRFHPDEVAKLD